MEKKFDKRKMVNDLQDKYPFALKKNLKEVYIYGTGLLGQL